MSRKVVDTVFKSDTTKYTLYYAVEVVEGEFLHFRAPLFFTTNDSTLKCILSSSESESRMDFPDFRKNYTVGQSWEYYANPEQKIKRQVISINETITVEAGTFHNCIKIVKNWNDEDRYLYWLRNDIGIIKQDVRINGTMLQLLELKSKNF